MFKLLQLWAKEAAKRCEGEISKEDYDDWRYNFPERDTSGLFHKAFGVRVPDSYCAIRISAVFSGKPIAAPSHHKVEVSDKLNELLTEELIKNRK